MSPAMLFHCENDHVNTRETSAEYIFNKSRQSAKNWYNQNKIKHNKTVPIIYVITARVYNYSHNCPWVVITHQYPNSTAVRWGWVILCHHLYYIILIHALLAQNAPGAAHPGLSMNQYCCPENSMLKRSIELIYFVISNKVHLHHRCKQDIKQLENARFENEIFRQTYMLQQ